MENGFQPGVIKAIYSLFSEVFSISYTYFLLRITFIWHEPKRNLCQTEYLACGDIKERSFSHTQPW